MVFLRLKMTNSKHWIFWCNLKQFKKKQKTLHLYIFWLYQTKLTTVLQTEEKWERTKVKKDKSFTVESYPRKTSSRLNVSHRACQHAQDTQICQVEPEREREFLRKYWTQYVKYRLDQKRCCFKKSKDIQHTVDQAEASSNKLLNWYRVDCLADLFVK